MQQPGNQGNKNTNQNLVNISSMTAIAGQVGCLTLIVVIGALFGGMWLDKILNTRPVFMIILLLGSAPLALVLTFWAAKRAISNAQLPPPDLGKKIAPSKKYDDEGDDDQ